MSGDAPPGGRPVPAGLSLAADPGLQVLDDGQVLLGGAPLRLLRLRPGGARRVAAWTAGRPVGAGRGERALARRLLDAGMFHPRPAGGPPPDVVTIVVPVRDRPAALRRCLAALRTTAPASPVIVVDDGSADRLAAVRAATTAGARYVRRARPGGPAAARNTGLSAATTPYVAFVDSDCMPSPGWLTHLLPHFTDPAVAAVAPRITATPTHRPPEGEPPTEAPKSPDHPEGEPPNDAPGSASSGDVRQESDRSEDDRPEDARAEGEGPLTAHIAPAGPSSAGGEPAGGSGHRSGRGPAGRSGKARVRGRWGRASRPALGWPRSPRVKRARRARVKRARRGALVRYEEMRSALDMGPQESIVRPGARVPYVPSATVVVRRAALADAADVARPRAVGVAFDEVMPVGEDVDLIWRLAASGWRVRYEPRATVAHEHRTRARAWFARRADYGTSAAPLAARHPDVLPAVSMSGWSAAAWGLVAVGHPAAGLALTAAVTARLADRLTPLTARPLPLAVRLAGLGTLGAGRLLGSAVTRTWWPFALPAAVAVRRLRLPLATAVLAPPAADYVAEWRRARAAGTRPALDPARYIAVRLCDDVAYSVGVWRGCVRHRTVRPLLPRLWWRSAPTDVGGPG